METKEQIDKMPEVTDDLTGEMTVEELKKILVMDIDKYKKHLEQLAKEKVNYAEQLKIDEEIWDIVENPETFKILKPTFEYEALPRYQELQRIKMSYKIRHERAKAKGNVEQMDFEEKMIREDLADKEEKLAKLEGGKNE